MGRGGSKLNLYCNILVLIVPVLLSVLVLGKSASILRDCRSLETNFLHVILDLHRPVLAPSTIVISLLQASMSTVLGDTFSFYTLCLEPSVMIFC